MRSPTPVGKRRTRQHIIADLGVNHVERIALRAGFTVERATHDYGIDLVMTTYDQVGDVEPGSIYLQVKATEHLTRLRNSRISFSVSERDLNRWLPEFHPVILALWDAGTDHAYWVHIQSYFAALWETDSPALRAFRSILFPRRCYLDVAAMLTFAEMKRILYVRMREFQNAPKAHFLR